MDGELFTFSARRFPPTLSHPLSAICSRLRAHNHCAPFVFDMSPAPRRPIRSSFQWSTADDWVISEFNLGDVHVAHRWVGPYCEGSPPVARRSGSGFFRIVVAADETGRIFDLLPLSDGEGKIVISLISKSKKPLKKGRQPNRSFAIAWQRQFMLSFRRSC